MLNSSSPCRTLCRRVALLLGLLLLGALPALGDEVKDAAKLLKTGQHEQALERVNKVLASRPNDPQARFMKGLIYTEQGKTREAIDIFTKLTQDYPELPEPYNNLAVIYASQGQYDKARAALEQSIRTHPSYATAYENLGDVYAKLASQAYDKALQLDSSNAGAQNKLSLVRELVGGPVPVAKPGSTAATTRPAESVAQAAKPAAAAAAPSQAKPAAAAKPAPLEAQKQPDKGPAAGGAPAEDVLAAVQGWAKAWSKQDVQGYLSFYAGNFDAPRDMSREAWEKQRRDRVSGPMFIDVTIASPKVTMQGSDEASVTFRQTYRSDRLRSTTTKTLVLVRDDGRWRIRQERQGR